MCLSKITASHLNNIFKSSTRFDRILQKVKILSIGDGNLTAEVKVSEEHSNPMGGLHGGFSATLVDSLSSYALFSHKNCPGISVSVDIHMKYFKGATIGDELEIETKTIKAGKNIAFLEVFIRNKATKELLVQGSHTKFILNK